jgi:hypothetical protein
LELADLPGFQAKISGLTTATQKIDLDSFAFSAGESVTWAQSGTSGTLTVHDGAKVAHLTLIGTYVTSDFALANDQHGGTFVKGAQPAALTQAAAGMPDGHAALAVGHAGGRASEGAAVSPVVAAMSGR